MTDYIQGLDGKVFLLLSLFPAHAFFYYLQTAGKSFVHFLRIFLADVIQGFQMVAEGLKGQILEGRDIDEKASGIYFPYFLSKLEAVHGGSLKFHIQKIDSPFLFPGQML